MLNPVFIKDPTKLKAVAMETVYLLWKAACYEDGYGALRARPMATKEEVFMNALHAGDYPGNMQVNENSDEEGKVYMDYVFGRCLKTEVKWGLHPFGDAGRLDPFIEVSPNEPRPTYQCWNRSFKRGEDVVRQACKNLDVEILP